MERMAQSVAKSGLFGVKTAEQALGLMMIAQAEGTHPATAARDYHIIQGRPALKADTMLARFQAAGGKVNWTEYSDKRVAGTFSHPQGGSLEIVWDEARAKQAGLWGRDNWKNYPRAMMRSRVISEAVRTIYPGIATGIYTVEEVQDMVDVTPTMQQQEAAAHFEATTGTDLSEHMTAMAAATNLNGLQLAFGAAWAQAKAAGDEPAKTKLKAAYEARKGALPVTIEQEAF
jgi:hypothetical protein